MKFSYDRVTNLPGNYVQFFLYSIINLIQCVILADA